MISSFDIFDTVIIRSVVRRPWDVCLFIQMRMDVSFPLILRKYFFQVRWSSEMVARVFKKKQDVTLDAIYIWMGRLFGFSPELIDRIKQVELDVEFALCQACPGALEAVSKQRQAGHRIIFISDMHLPLEHLKRMLVKVGGYKEGDGVYVSGDSGLTKSSGDLYRYVLKQEGIAPALLTHTGDNEKSDVRVPRGLGISAELWPKRTASDQVIGQTGKKIIGPAFLFYVWWVLENARKDGIKRIYFLARDGEILFKIALVLNKCWGYGLDCRYLYVSRESLFAPAITRITDFEWEWLTAVGQDLHITLKTMADRLGISLLKLVDVLKQQGVEVGESSLIKHDLEKVKAVFFSDGFTSFIVQEITDKFNDTCAYLRQEGLMDDVPLAVVDIGWRGSIQYVLSNILDKAGCRQDKGIAGYYFGVSGDVVRYKNDRVEPFLISAGRRRHLTNNVLFCEVFAAAPHPKTKGYVQGRPVFEKMRQEVLDWGVEHQHQSILKFTEDFVGTFKPEWIKGEDILKVLDKVLYRFIVDPTKEEAEVYGRFPLTVQMVEHELSDLAPEFDWRSGKLPRTYWVSGSCVRSNFLFGKWVWRFVQGNPWLIKGLRELFLRLSARRQASHA